MWDNLHKVKSQKGGWWNGNPDTSFLTGDRIDDSTRKCILLKRRMNYDSFHIKQTYLQQRALRVPSTSTDTITNWPANHLVLASKVQIRYLRSLKADSTVCWPSSLLISELFPTRKRLGLSCNMKKILDNSPRLKEGGYFTARILHANWNSPLILPPCLRRLGGCGVVRGNFPRLMR